MKKRTKQAVTLPPLEFKHPRQSCGYCANLVFDYCTIFKDKVPMKFIRKQNDCEYFDDPFSS